MTDKFECDYCEEVFADPDLGPIELFGSQVYYVTQGEPESQLMVSEDETICHDCSKNEYFDEDEMKQYSL